ncbi:hypothetical protein MF271_24450 (plasmid) [Deinococcus sp. KNUC1210]|uniref:hypothetical protein n=1 Tax=Deinococcus sp. KNUC1210 TaxID=2917691 RepID=UPI001EF0C399|nr:hypothetical protein [Deinococcus sp. KNUC1210]ULH18108.1 hypothetical protein MF271_24450 [Deinococcus sp. KNUC1210]
MTFDALLHEQATRRLLAYRDALAEQGLHPGLPFRTLAVLTTDLPGEVIELAVTLEDGTHRVQRARPVTPIAPTASRVHGLTVELLQDERPLRTRRRSLEHLLNQPDASGRAVPLVIWAGEFAQEALSNSFETPFTVPILSLQPLIQTCNLAINPSVRYRPSLDGMNWTVPLREPNRTSALSVAQVTRALVDLLLTGEAIRTAPPRTVP